MASTIKNFLVGIGYDYDKKGEKQIGSGLDSIKSKALQLGAVVAGAFGIKALTSDFADAKDNLGQFSKVFGVAANDVNALGQALVKEGGSLDGFLGQLSGIEKLRAGLLVGDAGFIAALGKAKIPESVVTGAENATEAYIALAGEFENMNQQEKLNAAKSLGLDEASINLLSKGEEEVRRIVEAQKAIRPISKEMIASAREYKEETADLGNNIGGFADKVSVRLLPEINNIMSGMNSWLDVNREVINSGIDGVLDVVADNFGLIAGTLGIIAASSAFGMFAKMGRFIPVVGRLVTAFGLLGSGLMSWAAAAFVAYQAGKFVGDLINDVVNDTSVGDAIGKGVTFVAAGLGSEEAQLALERDAQNTGQQNADKEREEQEAKANALALPVQDRQARVGRRRGQKPQVEEQTENPLALVPVQDRPTRQRGRRGRQNPTELPKEDFAESDMELGQPSTPLASVTPIGTKQGGGGESTTKIEVRNVIEMDGNVISDKINTEMGKEVERALNDTASTNEG